MWLLLLIIFVRVTGYGICHNKKYTLTPCFVVLNIINLTNVTHFSTLTHGIIAAYVEHTP